MFATRLKREEAHSGLGQAFDEPMVLLDQIVEVLDLPQFGSFWKESSGFQIGNRFGVGCVFVDVDHSWSWRSGGEVNRSLGLDHWLPKQTSMRN